MTRQKSYRLMKAVPALVAAALCSVSLLVRADDVSDRVDDSTRVFKELAANKENGLPINMLNKAACVVILPSVKKAGFIVGAQYGRGVMSCRSGTNFDRHWSQPIMMQSSGGSFGLQAGGQATDFVILVMNNAGARSVMNGRAKLGTDASIAAGPVGRTAEASTTGTMQAQMLSYSRTQGVFAGVSLSGSSLGPDDDDNKKLYGKKLSGEDIFAGNAKATPATTELTNELEKTSPTRMSGEEKK
jgi:SH3 domain-containing YSC84-like protein 1